MTTASRRSVRSPRGDQRWSTFLRNHAKPVVACDFLVRVTATFRLLYVFVVIEHGSRKLLYFNVTRNPCAHWTLQQLREALAFNKQYRYLMHDRDRIFAKHLDESIAHLGVKISSLLHKRPRPSSAGCNTTKSNATASGFELL